MDNLAFLKIIILTLINLLGYLLSIFFIASLYYTKILSFYFEKEERDFLDSQYKDLSISFVFHTFCFLGYIATIFIMIYKSDLSIVVIENPENKHNNNDIPIINNNQNNILEKYDNNIKQNNIRVNMSEDTENGMDGKESRDPANQVSTQNNKDIAQLNNNNHHNDNNQENKEDKCKSINVLINIIIFFICQFFYLLHLILISIDLNHSKELFKEDIFDRYKFIKRIYTDILVSGYIFFVVFVLTSVWVFVFTREKFNCLPNFNIKTLDYLDNYFDKFLKNTPEQLEKSNKKMDTEIEKLKIKRDELKNEINNIQNPDYNNI